LDDEAVKAFKNADKFEKDRNTNGFFFSKAGKRILEFNPYTVEIKTSVV